MRISSRAICDDIFTCHVSHGFWNVSSDSIRGLDRCCDLAVQPAIQFTCCWHCFLRIKIASICSLLDRASMQRRSIQYRSMVNGYSMRARRS